MSLPFLTSVSRSSVFAFFTIQHCITMKKILLICTAFTFSLALNAQTTALDFEKNDCAGTNHHLFAELDSGYVCILEFVMMGCQPCITAGNGLKTIHAQFEASNPGKVRFYSMGFQNTISCTQMNNWKTANNFNHTMFAGDKDQVIYYGGMGMPTVIILGGLTEHKIYYNNQGYTPSQNTAIINAINLAISESNPSGTKELLGKEHFNAFPNPFDNTLTVQVKDAQATHISLSDIAGKEILREGVRLETGSTEVNLATESLQPGFYFVSLYDGDRIVGLQKLVKE